MSYPPSPDDVLQAFIEWLNRTRNADYTVEQRPDRRERNRKEIDYLLMDRTGGPEVAVEASSIWRSNDAGREDVEWLRWTEQVRNSVNVPGQFRISTPLRIPRGLPADEFAQSLVESLKKNLAEMAALGEGRYLNIRIRGLDLHVALVHETGSSLTFGRQLPDAETRNFPDQVRRILAAKAPKLKQHKDAGRETWIIVYNTFWPAMSPYEVEQVFIRWLTPGLQAR